MNRIDLFPPTCLCALVLLGGCGPAGEDGGAPVLIAPAAGATLLAGDTVAFRWTGALDLASLDARWRPAPESAWETLGVISKAPGQVTAELPAAAAESLQVRLADGSGAAPAVTYRAAFFVFTAGPDTGRTYHRGDTVRIAWRMSPLVGETLIWLWSNRGRNSGYITGSLGVPAPETTYTWIVGGKDESLIAYPSRDCSLELSDYVDEWKSARSRGYFQLDP